MWRAALMMIVLAAPIGPACADDMHPPTIVAATVDWNAAKATLAPEQTLAMLNEAVGTRFPNIGASAVPVLLPMDVAAFLRDRAAPSPAAGSYFGGFRPTDFFLAGPGGYDAAFTLTGGDAPDLPGVRLNDEGLVHLSGLSFLYVLEPPVGASETAVSGWEKDFPGLRRVLLENYVRYVFERYGATYVVSARCFDGGHRARWISCSDADRIIVKFLGLLRLAGGSVQTIEAKPPPIRRPNEESPDFTYESPGKLIPHTGMRGHDGLADYTVYANIRFPLAQAPAYANSQSFLNWGDCDHTGRTSHSTAKGASYNCRVNAKPLVFDESSPENRSYPWRDNFCEHRHFFVGQCPAGEGHQGQDIRPATCKLRNEGGDRCLPYQDDVVAARDGMLLRVARQESMFLVVDRPGAHLRFRYLHMNPKLLDADGMVHGRIVHAGDVLGKADNFDRHQNGTTYHLHFELQVPTKNGWVFVNPYMTLVASYEHLIGGRGLEIKEIAFANAVPGALTAETPRDEPSPPNIVLKEANRTSAIIDKENSKAVQDRHCRTELSGGTCDARAAHSDSAKQRLRKTGRRFSRAGHRARHFRRHFVRHGRAHAGHVHAAE